MIKTKDGSEVNRYGFFTHVVLDDSGSFFEFCEGLEKIVNVGCYKFKNSVVDYEYPKETADLKISLLSTKLKTLEVRCSFLFSDALFLSTRYLLSDLIEKYKDKLNIKAFDFGVSLVDKD